MKTKILLLSCMLVLFSSAANGQAVPKADILMWAQGAYGGGVEYFFSPRISAQVELYYAASSTAYLDRSEALLVFSQVRFYPIGENRPRGFFAAPTVVNAHSSSSGREAKASIMGLGLLAGIQSQIGRRFTFDAGLGPLYTIEKTSGSDKAYGWTGMLKFSVGFSLFPMVR